MERQENARVRQVLTAADTLMDLITGTADGLEPGDMSGIKTLTAALKDLRDIQSKAEAELRAISGGEDAGTGVILIPNEMNNEENE